MKEFNINITEKGVNMVPKMTMTPVGPKRVNYPTFIQGLMRTDGLNPNDLINLLRADLEYGLTYLDTSDIYTNGYCEELLGKAFVLEKGIRDKFTLQTKCGIIPSEKGFNYYDFSKEHILAACEASLRRLQTDHIDFYLLHRPDALFEPEEIAEAFDELSQSGKVLHFGVSNMNTQQLSYLKQFVDQDIEVNQLQMSVAHTMLIDADIMMNRAESLSIDHNQGILNYCRAIDCTIQAWSPFRSSKSELSGSLNDRLYKKIETRPYLGSEEFMGINRKLEEYSKIYNVSPAAISIAWILRHPAKMQIVLGSSKPARIIDALDGLKVSLSREEWYDIYLAGGNIVP